MCKSDSSLSQIISVSTAALQCKASTGGDITWQPPRSGTTIKPACCMTKIPFLYEFGHLPSLLTHTQNQHSLQELLGEPNKCGGTLHCQQKQSPTQNPLTSPSTSTETCA